ncbi:MAG: hypothetical protein ABL893_10495 [Hyphomicrobium sp.]
MKINKKITLLTILGACAQVFTIGTQCPDGGVTKESQSHRYGVRAVSKPQNVKPPQPGD